MSVDLSQPEHGEDLFTSAEWAAVTEALRLTSRQQAIIQGLLRGHCDKAIAADLGISVATVRTHLSRLYQRLHVPDRVSLLLRVFRISRETSRMVDTSAPEQA